MPPTCVIDPGHGGPASGAVGPTRLLEKEVTLDLALRTAALLRRGANVTCTRDADVNLGLADRADVARQLGADVFLSIHLNAHPRADRAVNGTETWVWDPPPGRSSALAGAVQERLVAALGLHNRGVRNSGNMGVLRASRHDPRTDCCLAEVSFISSTEEEARLRTGDYRARIAHALAGAVNAHLRLGIPGLEEAPAPDASISLARQALDLWHEVPLVPQQTGMSCWAAAAAMIVGWRDRLPVEPLEVAQAAGRWREYRDGLQPQDVPELARTWGLALETAHLRRPQDLANLLASHGPLWVGEASPGLHSVVVTGMQGDGTPEGTKVRIADPWPMERGERYSVPFGEFLRNIDAAGADGGGTQILHARGRGAGARQEVRFRESFVARYGGANPDAYPSA